MTPAERIAAAEAQLASFQAARERLNGLLQTDQTTAATLRLSIRTALYVGGPPAEPDVASLAQAEQSAHLLSDALRVIPLHESFTRRDLARAAEDKAVEDLDAAIADLENHQAQQAALLGLVAAMEGGAASIEIAGDVTSALRAAIETARFRLASATEMRRRKEAEWVMLSTRPEFTGEVIA